MPEDNRFAGLSEAVDDDGRSEDGSESEPTADDDSSVQSDSTEHEFDESSVAPDSEGGDAAADGSNGAGSDSEPSEPDDPTAFPFDAAEKKTVYVRSETLDELEDARALVDAQLRTEHDVRDLTGREFYDAAFRLAASDTDGLIDEVLEARDD
ncbi:hypothetical protein [Natronorubrum halophilum]|uniref:hypothetical protein n=1 Tax=Natronorubrum halophilum TaxID=1702106 RepID=UPI0010C212DC|nr:hypothetical protein [Natronorubrum halophilum]